MAANTFFLSWIATGIYNLDSQRFQKASLDTRSEGWTETWSSERNGTPNDEETTTSEKKFTVKNEREMEIDDDFISQLLSTPHPQSEIVLTQHRPAWFEQMLMRVAGISHIVLNSTHISNEATGQLPFLRDCIPSKPPVLVGRNHPSNIKKSDNIMNNSILMYLQKYRNVDLDEQAGLSTDQQLGSSKCFQYMINLELSKILLHLRFEDSDAWDQSYRGQYVEASNIQGNKKCRPGSVKNFNFFIELRGRFQALMERNVERKRLLGYGRSGENKSISQLVERANEAYFAIDRQLQCIIKEQDETNSNRKYLLGTNRPALVDVSLFAHLADALCDVHLVVLLASYPRLVNYFQGMYHAYFSSSEGLDAECSWKVWNEQQNQRNAFQKIPTLSKLSIAQCIMIKDTVDLMQKSSLQKQNLQEVLDAVKATRAKECQPKPRKLKSFLLYRWCMGETYEKKSTLAEESQDNPLRKKLLRDQARNDQMWISGIFSVSAIAVILIRGGP